MTMTPVDHFWSLTFLTFLTLALKSTHATPINRQVGISENVFITVQNDTYGIEQRVCSIDSMTYGDGETIPTSSPCEHCICRPPGFACTIISCEYRPGCKAFKRSNQCCPEYQCECEKDGKIYQNGDKIVDSNNPCEICYCQGGEIVCAVIDCYWRSDCQPRYIESRCCPLYDHCPPPANQGPFPRPTMPTTTTTSPGFPWFNLSSAVYEIPEGSSQTPMPFLESSTNPTTTPLAPELVVIATQKVPIEVNIMATAQEESALPNESAGATGIESVHQEVQVPTEASVVVPSSEVPVIQPEVPAANAPVDQKISPVIPEAEKQPIIEPSGQEPAVQESTTYFNAPAIGLTIIPSPVEDIMVTLDVPVGTPEIASQVSEDKVSSSVVQDAITQSENVVEVDENIRPTETLPSIVHSLATETVSISEVAPVSQVQINATEQTESLVSSVFANNVNEVISPSRVDTIFPSSQIIPPPPKPFNIENSLQGNLHEQVGVEVESFDEESEVPTTESPSPAIPSIATIIMPPSREPVVNVELEVVTDSPIEIQKPIDVAVPVAELQPPQNEFVTGPYQDEQEVTTVVYSDEPKPIQSEVVKERPALSTNNAYLPVQQEVDAEVIVNDEVIATTQQTLSVNDEPKPSVVKTEESGPDPQQNVEIAQDEAITESTVTDVSPVNDVTNSPNVQVVADEPAVTEQAVVSDQPSPPSFVTIISEHASDPAEQPAFVEQPILSTEQPVLSDEPAISEQEAIPTENSVAADEQNEFVAPTEQPSIIADEPVVPTEQPVAILDELAAPTQQSDVVSDEPAAPTEKTVVVSDQPIVPTEQPTAIFDESVVPTEQSPVISEPVDPNQEVSDVASDQPEVISKEPENESTTTNSVAAVESSQNIPSSPVEDIKGETEKQEEEQIHDAPMVPAEVLPPADAETVHNKLPTVPSDANVINLIDDDTFEIVPPQPNETDSPPEIQNQIRDKEYAEDNVVSQDEIPHIFSPVIHKDHQAKPVVVEVQQPNKPNVLVNNDDDTVEILAAEILDEKVTTVQPSINANLNADTNVHDDVVVIFAANLQTNEIVETPNAPAAPIPSEITVHDVTPEDESDDQHEQIHPDDAENDEDQVVVTTEAPALQDEIISTELSVHQKASEDEPIHNDENVHEDESITTVSSVDQPSHEEEIHHDEPSQSDNDQQEDEHFNIATTIPSVQNDEISSDDNTLAATTTQPEVILNKVQKVAEVFKTKESESDSNALSSVESKFRLDLSVFGESGESVENIPKEENLLPVVEVQTTPESVTAKTSNDELVFDEVQQSPTHLPSVESLHNEQIFNPTTTQKNLNRDDIELSDLTTTGSPIEKEVRDDLEEVSATTENSARSESVQDATTESGQIVGVTDNNEILSDEELSSEITTIKTDLLRNGEVEAETTTTRAAEFRSGTESTDAPVNDFVEVTTGSSSRFAAEYRDDDIQGETTTTRGAFKSEQVTEINEDLQNDEATTFETPVFDDEQKSSDDEIINTTPAASLVKIDDESDLHSEASQVSQQHLNTAKSESLDLVEVTTVNGARDDVANDETDTTTHTNDEIFQDETTFVPTPSVALKNESEIEETTETLRKGINYMIIPEKGFPKLSPVSPEMVLRDDNKLARLDINEDDSWFYQTFNKIRQLSGLFPTSRTQKRLGRQPRDTSKLVPDKKTYMKKTKKATEPLSKSPKKKSLLPNRSFLFF